MFPASTSQAKGRVERLWETFQDRLITVSMIPFSISLI